MPTEAVDASPEAESDTRDLLDTPNAGPHAIRGGALRLASYLGGVALTVISAALLFRHLGVDDGGRYVTVLALVATASGLADFGLTSLGVRELSQRSEEDHDELVRNLVALRISLSLLGLIAAVSFAGIADYPSVMVAGTLLAGVGLLLQNLQQTYAMKLMVDLRLGWVSLLELARQAVVAVLIIVLVLAGATLVSFFAVQIVAGAVVVVWTAALVRHEGMPLRPAFHWEELRQLLRFVLPFAAAIAAGVIYFRLALVLLSLISNPTETGFFAAPFRVTEVLIAVPQLVVASALPIVSRAARDNRERLAYATGRIFEVMLALGAWVALMLTLGASFVIHVVAGPKFAPSTGVLRIQAFTLLLVFAYTSWSYALVGLRRHRDLVVATVAALVVNAVGVLILGSSHGARGAALATAIADLVALIAYGCLLARAGTPVLRSLVAIPRVALAAAPAALIWFVPVSSFAKAVIATVVYGAMLLLVRAVPEELLVELKRLRSRAT
jgi:O-antigen/teichoic acid export membrane protein